MATSVGTRTSTGNNVQEKWYDKGNLGELHDDLRAHFAEVFRVISGRPVLTKHFQECDVCQSIKLANESKVTELITKRRRMKYVITPSQMAEILGLPAGHEVVIMYAKMDPNVIEVIVAGDGAPEAPEGAPAPITKLRLVA